MQLLGIGNAAPGHHPAGPHLFGIVNKNIDLATNLAAQFLNRTRIRQVQRNSRDGLHPLQRLNRSIAFPGFTNAGENPLGTGLCHCPGQRHPGRSTGIRDQHAPMARVIGQFAQLNILPQIGAVQITKGHEYGPVSLVQKQTQRHRIAYPALRMKMGHHRYPARQINSADTPWRPFTKIQLGAGFQCGFSNQGAGSIGIPPVQCRQTGRTGLTRRPYRVVAGVAMRQAEPPTRCLGAEPQAQPATGQWRDQGTWRLFLRVLANRFGKRRQ